MPALLMCLLLSHVDRLRQNRPIIFTRTPEFFFPRTLIEKPEQLPARKPPTRLFVVHDPEGGGHDNVSELGGMARGESKGGR